MRQAAIAILKGEQAAPPEPLPDAPPEPSEVNGEVPSEPAAASSPTPDEVLERILQRPVRTLEPKPKEPEPAPSAPQIDSKYIEAFQALQGGGAADMFRAFDALGLDPTQLAAKMLDEGWEDGKPPGGHDGPALRQLVEEVKALQAWKVEREEKDAAAEHERQLQDHIREGAKVVSDVIKADSEGRWELLSAYHPMEIAREVDNLARRSEIEISLETGLDQMEKKLAKRIEEMLPVAKKARKFSSLFIREAAPQDHGVRQGQDPPLTARSMSASVHATTIPQTRNEKRSAAIDILKKARADSANI